MNNNTAKLYSGTSIPTTISTTERIFQIETLQAATGPNDAALRGGMICDMRDIAIEAIRIYEPDYTPFK